MGYRQIRRHHTAKVSCGIDKSRYLFVTSLQGFWILDFDAGVMEGEQALETEMDMD
jgi:hypothetical protein